MPEAPLHSEDQNRVVRFRPRVRRFDSNIPSGGRSPVEDIGKYERLSEDDDYRHRMTMNAIALAACALLVAAGIWLANTITEMRKTQDCVLSGRHNCLPLDIPLNQK
jgi:hypothetical protein